MQRLVQQSVPEEKEGETQAWLIQLCAAQGSLYAQKAESNIQGWQEHRWILLDF